MQIKFTKLLNYIIYKLGKIKETEECITDIVQIQTWGLNTKSLIP